MRGNMKEWNGKTQIWAPAVSHHLTLGKLLKGSQMPGCLLYDTEIIQIFTLEGPYENQMGLRHRMFGT